MSRLTIDEFRARLGSPRAGESALVRAYRELARRPDLAATMSSDGWIPWGRATTASAST